MCPGVWEKAFFCSRHNILSSPLPIVGQIFTPSASPTNLCQHGATCLARGALDLLWRSKGLV